MPRPYNRGLEIILSVLCLQIVCMPYTVLTNQNWSNTPDGRPSREHHPNPSTALPVLFASAARAGAGRSPSLGSGGCRGNRAAGRGLFDRRPDIVLLFRRIVRAARAAGGALLCREEERDGAG